MHERGDRPGVGVLPVARLHRRSVGSQPADLPGREEALTVERGVSATERTELADEGRKLVVGVLPVDPADVVVLAVGVVVATLRAGELVAADYQRHAV